MRSTSSSAVRAAATAGCGMSNTSAGCSGMLFLLLHPAIFHASEPPASKGTPLPLCTASADISRLTLGHEI